MANNAAIVGTTSSHGGTMTNASGAGFNTKQGPVCLVGDSHRCPIQGHNVTAIVSGGSAKTSVNGRAIAINGSVAGCGAVLNANFASDVSIA